MKNFTKSLILLLMFTSCNNGNTDTEKEAIFLADMKQPMGHKYLKIYKDGTFRYETKRLLKSTYYEGKVSVSQDTLNFEYTSPEPDVGNVALIDGIFLTYTNGVYRELLEISLNKLTK